MTKFIAWGQRIKPAAVEQPPGNSLGIIDAAYAAGYDGIELDVRLTKDGAMVLMHDDGVAKTTFGDGKISQMTLEEASTLRLRGRGGEQSEYLPNLAQALSHNGDRGYVMLDCRKLTPLAEAAIIKAVDIARFDPARFLFLSYNLQDGLRYQELYPQSTTLLKAPIHLTPPELTVDFVEESRGLTGVIAPIFAFPDAIAEFRERTQARGQKLGLYMHHQGIATLRKVVAMRPDFITSINPNDFAQIRDEFGLA